ncbi:MAG: HBL/NHE enterotoxin family protein [Nitrospina sp.]|jgi:hypothetical protein|nr:HBL/NHE enterotoxin family protein [Nitrospina sp.]
MGTIASIDLGDQGLLEAYLSCTRKALLSQTYSNLLETQQKLSLENFDSGLAVKINAYQAEMFTHARTFNNQSMPAIIHQMTYASNFSALMSALNKQLKNQDQLLLDNIKDISAQVQAIKETAETYQIFASALKSKLGVTWNSLQSLTSNYKEAMDQLETNLTAATQKIAQEILDLTELTSQNIQGIIDGGNKAGSGVSEIGDTIITIFNVSDKDEKKPGKDEEKEVEKKSENDEIPTQYLVSGLNAIVDGVSGSSQAASDLKITNKKLAEAYQKLAKANSLLSVAKSVQAQNELFSNTFEQTTTATAQLNDEWEKVIKAFGYANDAISSINSVEEIQSLKHQVELSAQKWKILSDQIDAIKLNYANVNSVSLPMAS